MQALQTVNNISFKNILFLTDFSEASETALAYARGIAGHFGAQVYPAHACNPIVLTEAPAGTILTEVEENARWQLALLARKNALTGTPLFVRGDVETAVPQWIDEHGIDLIVMGTHGRRGLKHFLLGSVAETIFRSATCPVLSVGPHVTVRPYQDFKAERILVPTDLGPHAEFAIRYALSVAHENRAQISFMHVVPLEEASQHDCRPVVDAAFRKLEKLIPDDANQWCEPELKVEIGNPAKELVRYAETERPDLIVLGLPADKKFNGHFRTGVTYNIVASAPCPVLTVRDLANDD
jgi:nucleotide-binding universal stress UspA family protein